MRTHVVANEILGDKTTQGVIKFKASEAIAAGDLVVIDGMDSSSTMYPTARKADANTLKYTDAPLWVCVEGAASGDRGLARPRALLTAQDTSNGAVGDAVYLSSTTRGKWSRNRPARQQRVGVILSVSSTTGVVLLTPQAHRPSAIQTIDRTRLFEDFFLDSGGTLPAPFAKSDYSPAGTPTLDYAADAADGAYALKLSTTNEINACALYLGDQLVIPASKKPIFECYLKVESDVTGAGGAFGANDKLVVGLIGNRQAAANSDVTLDNTTTNAWFMLGVADHNIYIETDDNTTDTDDKDTGIDWAEATWMHLRIDFTDLAAIKFYVNGALANNGNTMSLAALTTEKLQPYVELRKAAAANMDHRVTIDYVEVDWNRS